MARLQEIEKQIRRQKAKIRLFLRHAHRAGIRPFYGFDPRWASEREMMIAVTPDLQGKGWRVTWFVNGEPHGHTVRPTFDAAVEEAVVWEGLDLDTVQFAPAARDREAFRSRRTARIRGRRARRPT